VGAAGAAVTAGFVIHSASWEFSVLPPGRLAQASPESRISCLYWSELSVGFFCLSRARVPATCGVAIDVP
jgi:hypothetical protein